VDGAREERKLLKLKKLQILGFKSFCERTELKFHGDGIAAIVGPNGCGKSNIADAISWVLGEQSAKLLRGSRMEDVIFAGTRDRQPTGMAEVSLTLIDPCVYDGADPGNTPEIEISDELPDDWDEAALRAHASEEAARYEEEVRPLDPVEVPAAQQEGAATATAIAIETAEAPSESAGESGGPQVVLRIRRRTFKRREFTAGEIVVTRRLFRSGDSDYLLNGKLCRLRDIQELFMGTGLGPESYAIIEQGRIGQILSSKPHDRRAIIEEAAGITKFKSKKRLAEARLEQSRLNLARVNDIFEEVVRQMNSLKRQASKAERYGRVRDELRARLRVVMAGRFADMNCGLAALESQEQTLASDIQTRTAAAHQFEAEHQQLTQLGYSLESETRALADQLSEAVREMDRCSQQRQHNDERCAELTARSLSARAELTQSESQLASLNFEAENNREILANAAAEVAAAQSDCEAQQRNVAEQSERLRVLEAAQEQSRTDLMQAVGTGAEFRNQITQAQEHLSGMDRESQRLRQEISTAETEMTGFAGRRGQQALEFETASQRVLSLSAQISAARATLQQKRGEEGTAKRRLDSLRGEYASALGKRASLEGLLAEHGYSTDSVRRLFRSGALQGGMAPAGVLADFLEVDQQYEHVVEDFLRDELNYIVVKSWDAADHGLEMLRTDVDGRATFLVHPNDAQAKFSFTVDESTRHAPKQESIIPVSSCLRVLNGFGKSLEVILPKLRDGYIAPDSKVARELALQSPDAFFLSQSGECFHNVTVTGGKQRSEGPLSMKRELRDLTRQVGDLEAALREQEATVLRLGREIAELTTELEKLESEKLLAEKAALTSEHTLKQTEQELGRASERSGTCRLELGRILGELAEKESFIVARRAEAETLERHRSELEQRLAVAQEELTVARMDRDLATQGAAEMRAELAKLEERHRGAAAATQRLENMLAEATMRVSSLRGQIEAAAAEQSEREQQNIEIAERLTKLAADQAEGRRRAAELQNKLQEGRARLLAIEEQIKAARTQLDACRDQRSEVNSSIARLQSDVEHLRQDCLNELNAAPEALLQEPGMMALAGDELAAAENECRDMRARLEAMGPVNMMALEEYNETAQRHQFLDTQRKDLLDSITNTENTIREIENVSCQKFQEAFTHINENFQVSFKKLFGGGHAFMRLTDEEQGTESGIDLIASPPGKKLQNVLLLSGGEKALTALALLVGIFQYQPSPFCVLDEVDAPLDEVNVGRFVDMVRELSAQTQFVLITHSKKTMSAAPVLYGVTMQEPGVSKLVSVRFGAEAANP
jgi:chromosome segregation protein